jgi:uncharacterized membrane protein YkvA (DUF1232 family)
VVEDPFPRERVTAMLKRLPAYLRLSWQLAREPLLSKARRAAIVAAAGYLASPIDLVPGVIPFLGQLDDLAVALVALRFALAGLRPDRRRAHLRAAGLADEDLVADLEAIGATAAWTLRATVRASARVVVTTGHAVTSMAGRLRVDLGPALVAARRRVRPSRGPATPLSGNDRSTGLELRLTVARAGDAALTVAWPPAITRGWPGAAPT